MARRSAAGPASSRTTSCPLIGAWQLTHDIVEERQPRAVARPGIGAQRSQQSNEACIVFRRVAGQMRPLVREHDGPFRRREIGVEQRLEQERRVHAVDARGPEERCEQRVLGTARRDRPRPSELPLHVVKRGHQRRRDFVVSGKSGGVSRGVRGVHRDSVARFAERTQRRVGHARRLVIDERLERARARSSIPTRRETTNRRCDAATTVTPAARATGRIDRVRHAAAIHRAHAISNRLETMRMSASNSESRVPLDHAVRCDWRNGYQPARVVALHRLRRQREPRGRNRERDNSRWCGDAGEAHVVGIGIRD